MPRLFHVSEDGPFASMSPRPSPPGTEYEGRLLVWAVDERRLPNYLLPRDCPRVCWVDERDDHGVIAVEDGWAGRLDDAALQVHELAPDGFRLIDATAGYWVSEGVALVVQVERVDDCRAALAARGVELHVVASLWPLVDDVVAAGGEFSVIRIRNARPRFE